MPTPEHQPHSTGSGVHPDAPGGTPETGAGELHEQRYKTIAVRVEENLHTQLQFIADLTGTTLSNEVRRAIEGRIAAAQNDAALIARAQEAREQIEREAAARAAAIAGFMGQTAAATTVEKPKATARGRSNTKSNQ